MYRFFLITFALCLLLISAEAQDEHHTAIRLPANKSKVLQQLDNNTLRHVKFFEGQQEFTHFLQGDSILAAQAKLYSTGFKSDKTYWAKIKVENQADFDRDYILFLGYVSEAEVYVVYDDVNYQSHSSGFFVENHKLNPRQGQGQKVRITLQSQKVNTLLVKFKNSINYPPEPSFSLQDEASWQEGIAQTNLIQGIFQGLLWLILLYNLFLFFSLRDLTYLIFVAYIFTISAYFLNEYEFLEQYFLPNQPILSFHLGNLVYVASVFYLQFNRYILNIPQKYPTWDSILKVWLWLSIVSIILLFSLAPYDFQLYMQVRLTYHVAYALALFVFIFAVLWMNSTVANFFVFGNFAMVLGALLIIMGNLGVIPFSLYYLLGGIVAQLFIFMMALSYRYQVSIREARENQRKLIIQLEANQQLQTQVNRELEEKVRERTREIAQKNEEIETQNESLVYKTHELEKSQKKTQDSVRYAQRLQKAIMGDASEAIKHFRDGFVILLPKDVVSGDFYWSSKIGHLRILVASDCTGHGIPGALMTVLGNSILNDVVNEEGITSPDEILYELDKKVIQTIQKQTLGEHPKDGMDLIVIAFDEISYTMRYAGAKNPLYYVRDFEMHQIKGSNAPIGIQNKRIPKKFELHEFQAQEGDVFYLASDGFQDQFGGPKNQKYFTKRFRALLLRYSHLPMAEQKKKFLDEFYEWKEAQSQTDDVLLIGVQI